MTYQPTIWTKPDSYYGATHDDAYVFLSQSRDSSIVDRSNFYCALRDLKSYGFDFEVIRESHWAVGWIEWIKITEPHALMQAFNIAEQLDEYPVLDEMHLSELEQIEIYELWDGLSLGERIDLCRDHGLSIFAARHAYLTDETLEETLRGWL